MWRHRRLLVVVLVVVIIPAVELTRPNDASALLSAGSGLSSEAPAATVEASGATAGKLSAVGGRSSLLSATATGVSFRVEVPWESLRVEPTTVGRKEYVRVSLPGWSTTSQPGAPALPFRAEEIGAPFGVNVSVRVVPGPAHTVVLSAPPLPSATQKVVWKPPAASSPVPARPTTSSAILADEAVYGGQAAYPAALAEVAGDGVLRGQRVVGIAAYPVQYHPETGEITVYESLKVIVSFGGPESGLRQTGSELSAVADSAPYEELFRQGLLNHEAASAWRQTADPGPLPALTAAAAPWAPPAPGWRVKVRADGFYKLTYAELRAAGVPVDTLAPKTFQLYNQGGEVAIYVVGESDGKFNAADYIIFHGQALASKYTADNVYWLTYGKATGRRMGTRSGLPSTGTTPAYYMGRLHFEQNQYYVSLAPGDENLDRWLWDYLYPPSRPTWNYSFSLTAPYAGTTQATLTVALLGYLQNSVNPDHHARISLNGTQVGEAWWDGIAWQVVKMTVPAGLLKAGTNSVSVTCPNDTGLAYDVVYVDWVDLEFANTFRAEGDQLAFSYKANGTRKFQVDGFSSNQAAVYDVTNPAAVVRIVNPTSKKVGSVYSLVFNDRTLTTTNYWALSTAAYRTVSAIEADTASQLKSTANGADHIVISHRDFLPQAQTLRDFRVSQGLRTVLVDVQDVYDEFGYGVTGAAPIRDFLAYAYGNWQAPAPTYVVLVGDGHYDPKNYSGYGRVSYLPPYLAPVDPWMGETAADNRYVTVAGGDTLPDMMLGRLAVNSAAEAGAFINKILAYEQSPVPGEWRQQVLAIADNTDSAGNFAQLTDDLLTCCLPAPYQAEKVYYGATHTTASAARQAIQDGINDGKLLLNFTGHGYTGGWASEKLLTATDVPQFLNGGKLPLVLSMTCRDGYFIYPFPYANGQEALAEVLTRADGKGAAASWSPTGLGLSGGHDYLNRGFFEALFRDKAVTMGEGTTAGKLKLWATGQNLDLLDTFLLFGDPALRMVLIPRAVELMRFTATGNTGAVTLGWTTARETDNQGFNLYRATAVNGKKTKLNANPVAGKGPSGAVYSYQDTKVQKGKTYYYWLENVDLYGNTELHGPVNAQAK